MAYTIWDAARRRAGQNHTTVEIELSKMAKKGARRRAEGRRASRAPKASSLFSSAWAADASQARLPYLD